ncbi:DNA-3-methyladenine glycosylase II [Pseudohyphozyma bogoriensis]|nr:DNA-3-methyladenine glycosylase II [Pseudohyphozyma bogoriensis]
MARCRSQSAGLALEPRRLSPARMSTRITRSSRQTSITCTIISSKPAVTLPTKKRAASSSSSSSPSKRGKAAPPAASAPLTVAPAAAATEASPSTNVLLHPALTFTFADARAHLIAVDPRWRGVMDRLKCKPYEVDDGDEDEFNPFRSLATSIIGQQVSWLAARSITHKFVRIFFPHLPEKMPPPKHSAPGHGDDEVATKKSDSPFPTPAMIVALKDQTATLRAAGLSGRKVEYIVELAERFADGRLDAKRLWEMEDDDVRKTLLEVRGIGIWTVQMFLMFSMKRPDILAVGDLGLQKGLCKWYTSAPAINPRKLAQNGRQTTPPPSATPSQAAYPTPSSPAAVGDHKAAMEVLEAVGDVELPEEKVVESVVEEEKGEGMEVVFPETTSGLTQGVLKSRLAGKKLKGNMYLSPQEMEELTEAWKPYRSVGCWYLWSLVDAPGST